MKLVDLPDLTKGFRTIPSMAVMGKTPVWVKDEGYNPIRIMGSAVYPEVLAAFLSKHFETLHYIDITGIRKGKVEWNTLRNTSDQIDEVWADVGISFSDTIIDTLMSGASYGIISTKLVRSIEEIAAAFELTENVILQIDHDDGIVAMDPIIRKMNPGDLVREMASFGMDTFILEDLKNDPKGPSRTLLTEILAALPSKGRLFAGAESFKDLVMLDNIGVDGGIISVSRLVGDIR